MKLTLHSTILHGLLVFAVGSRAAPIDPRAKSVSLGLGSRALFSGEGELAARRGLLPEGSVLEERMGDIAYDEEIYNRADEIYDLSYRLDAVPTPADRQLHAPPHPRHNQTPPNHLEARGIKAFFKKVWRTAKNVAKNAFGTVKDVVKTFKTHGAKAFFKQAFNTVKGVVGKNLKTVKDAVKSVKALGNRGLADKLVDERSDDIHRGQELPRGGVKLRRSKESLGQ